jgi:molecular chaperone HtpG
VRKQIGFRLLTELIIVQGQHPDVYADIVRLHADGLKALAVQEPDVRDLLIATLPFETTLGERTIQKLLDGTGPVPFVRDADTYAALADVAAHAGVLVVNAGGLHEAELLGVANDEAGPGHFREVTAADVVELARPVPHPDAPAAAALAAKARAAIAEAASSSTSGASSPPTGPCCGGPPRPATPGWC